jgi:hypothetical protein
MIEFTEYLRDSHAQQKLVNKIGGIYRVNQNIIKCTFVLASPGAGGIVQAVEQVSLLRGNRDVYEAHDQLDWAFREISRGTFMTDEARRCIRAH